MPITPTKRTGLNRRPLQKCPTGIKGFDEITEGGLPKNRISLFSGSTGTGKTLLGLDFLIDGAIQYNEGIGRPTRSKHGSIGLHFELLIKKRLLKIVSTRPSFFGLEMHLLEVYKTITEFKPHAVVIDPLTSLIGQGNPLELQSMLTRMIDLLKSKGITGFFTSLVSSAAQNDTSGEIGVSSLIDTWIVVRELEENQGRRRVRGLYIVKSRGMGHSSDIHKLILSDDGICLVPMDSDATASPRQKMRVGKATTVSRA